jgi:hypothetical protein
MAKPQFGDAPLWSFVRKYCLTVYSVNTLSNIFKPGSVIVLSESNLLHDNLSFDKRSPTPIGCMG